jgi:hypothetical protein
VVGPAPVPKAQQGFYQHLGIGQLATSIGWRLAKKAADAQKKPGRQYIALVYFGHQAKRFVGVKYPNLLLREPNRLFCPYKHA